jgi:hypothetical protein
MPSAGGDARTCPSIESRAASADASGQLLHASAPSVKHFVCIVERPEQGGDLLTHEEFAKAAGTRSAQNRQ